MPTIDIKKKDLDRLIGQSLPLPVLEERLMLAKAELKEYAAATDDLKVELADSNRPDLWSAEGVARQIRIARTGRQRPFPFPKKGMRPERVISVERALKGVRPYIAACAAVGVPMNDDVLAQMIQSQDKLSDIFGRKRSTVSIGMYELDRIDFPVSYRLAEPGSVSFTPLGMTEKLTLAEIIERHPKGIAYGSIVKGLPRYPVLTDRSGSVLSFPPIINSAEIGEVKTTTRRILVEVTGTDLRMIALTLNILAWNLADRGARIEPVLVEYPYETEFGKMVVFPVDTSGSMKLPLSRFVQALGEDIPLADLRKRLAGYGHTVTGSARMVTVSFPGYRDDILHPMDLVEDYAISRGYGSFEPVMPRESTVGSLSEIELLADTVRSRMIGAGFQEVTANILCSRPEVADALLPGERLVEVDNAMSLAYAVLRNSALPSLLNVEAASSKAFYPHRIFEAGEVSAVDDASIMGTRTDLNLAGLLAHPGANFSEMHSVLDVLFYYLGLDYRLEPSDHPLFMQGRCGRVLAGSSAVGYIGELRPEVLERRQITMPCAGFELSLNRMLELLAVHPRENA